MRNPARIPCATATGSPALASGSIDATLVSPPDHFEALRAGMKILLNLRELNVPYQGSGLVTTQRVLIRKRDLVRRFLKSYVEAIHLVNRVFADPDTTVAAARDLAANEAVRKEWLEV